MVATVLQYPTISQMSYNLLQYPTIYQFLSILSYIILQFSCLHVKDYYKNRQKSVHSGAFPMGMEYSEFDR